MRFTSVSLPNQTFHSLHPNMEREREQIAGLFSHVIALISEKISWKSVYISFVHINRCIVFRFFLTGFELGSYQCESVLGVYLL